MGEIYPELNRMLRNRNKSGTPEPDFCSSTVRPDFRQNPLLRPKRNLLCRLNLAFPRRNM